MFSMAFVYSREPLTALELASDIRGAPRGCHEIVTNDMPNAVLESANDRLGALAGVTKLLRMTCQMQLLRRQVTFVATSSASRNCHE